MSGALDALKAIGLGVAGRALGTGGPGPLVETGVSFDDLIAKARRGEVRSDLPVEIGRGAGVELDADQLAALGVMADRAQAQGVTSALVLTDDASFTLDVVAREVTGPGAWDDGVLGWVDGVIDLRTNAAGGAGGTGAQDALTPEAARALLDRLAPNASLLRLLGERDSAPGAELR